MIVDSHCHLDLCDLTPFDNDMAALLQAAKDKGVERFLCVSVDLAKFPKLLEIAESYPDILLSVGLHPSETAEQEPTVETLTALAKHPLVVAIGETGLDYHYNQGDLTWQRDRFRTHIQAARACQKPLIIHTRDARADTIDILQTEQAADCQGVMHCFTETWEMAKAAMDLGFYISFSGIVTFKNAKDLQAVAKKMPLDRILIETDSPYLTPVPFRGKPNSPMHVYHVAHFLAELRGESVDTIATATTENFNRLFC